MSIKIMNNLKYSREKLMYYVCHLIYSFPEESKQLGSIVTFS